MCGLKKKLQTYKLTQPIKSFNVIKFMQKIPFRGAAKISTKRTTTANLPHHPFFEQGASKSSLETKNKRTFRKKEAGGLPLTAIPRPLFSPPHDFRTRQQNGAQRS